MSSERRCGGCGDYGGIDHSSYLPFRCPCRGACRERPLLTRCQRSPARTGIHLGRLLPYPPRWPPSACAHTTQTFSTSSGKIREQRSLSRWIVLPTAACLARAAVVFYSCLGELGGLMSWRWVGAECPTAQLSHPLCQLKPPAPHNYGLLHMRSHVFLILPVAGVFTALLWP